MRIAAPAAAWIALGALGALALWCALSIAASVAPDRSWDEVNRVLSYALAFALGLAAGTSAPRAIPRAAGGWVLVATLVALYALAGAVAPGIVDHAADEARLRAPLDRFGSLAAVCALAVPVAVRLAAAGEARSRRWVQLASLGAALVLVVVLGLTWSRSGALALAVATIVALGLGDRRGRSVALLVLVLAAAAPALAFAWSSDALTSDGAPLGARIDDGRTLGLVVLGGLVAVLVLGWATLRIADRPRSPGRLGARRRRLPGWVSSRFSAGCCWPAARSRSARSGTRSPIPYAPCPPSPIGSPRPTRATAGRCGSRPRGRGPTIPSTAGAPGPSPSPICSTAPTRPRRRTPRACRWTSWPSSARSACSSASRS